MPLSKKIIPVAKSYVDGFLSLFYPNKCVVCGGELNSQTEFFCFSCLDNLHFTHFEKYGKDSASNQVFWGRLNIEFGYSMLYFEKGNSTQHILHQIKYNEGKELGHYMGKLMGKRLNSCKDFQDVDCLIPVPVHSKKEFKRGYNQSLFIANGVGETTKVTVKNALNRRKNDASQTRKSSEERYKNAQNKFKLKNNSLKGCQHVMIIDDVLTTGATLEFAARAIWEAKENMKISVATIALAHG